MRERGDVLNAEVTFFYHMRVHFGLGDATSVDGIEIHWPSGKIEQFKIGSVDRIFTVEEGKGVIGEFCNGCAQSSQP